jgi:putative glycosyltransferase (TIGR04348 family)
MRVCIVTPARRHTHLGNRVTAVRWGGHLRALGHQVSMTTAWEGEPADALVVLHARRSADSALRWRELRGAAPLVLALTGTDLYQDLPAGSAEAERSIALADRLVVLQPLALAALPPAAAAKARVVLQGASPPRGVAPWAPPAPPRALVLAHLRAVKDPLLPAEAAGRLPPASRDEVVHLGAALDPDAPARAEAAAGARWRWGGQVAHGEALRRLAGAWLLVVPSRLEGGANVVSEAIACGVPVLGSRVDGTVGLLGEEYPGYFPPGDAAALAALLLRCEREPAFRERLRAEVLARAPLHAPAREREAWRALLAELAPGA